MKDEYTIREIKSGEEELMHELIKPVFEEFVAPIFSEEGIEEFHKVIKPKAIQERIASGNRIILVAEQKKVGKLIGVIEIRDINHISLFFVSKDYHSKGIGRKLLQTCIDLCKKRNKELRKITVHSSPNAVPIYKKLGFKQIGDEQVENGIHFNEMVLSVT